MILGAILAMDLSTAYNVIEGYMEVHTCEETPCPAPAPPMVSAAMHLVNLSHTMGLTLDGQMGRG